jgi:uncharacterized protein
VDDPVSEPADAPEPVVPDDETLREILGRARTIAVVGLSSHPDRPSNDVARFLQERGYRIVPVNPKETEVLAERAYASLADIPSDMPIDIVDVFRRSDQTPAIAREAAAVGADTLWLQEGIVNDEAGRIASDAGLVVTMGVCIRRTIVRLERAEPIGGTEEP